MYRTHIKYYIPLTLLLLIGLPNAYADMSKCKLADGSYYFSDTGCKGGALVQKKKMKPSANNARGINNFNTVGGCSDADKKRADDHFAEAKKINDSYAESYDERKTRKRKYEHEMTYAKSILAACSGSDAPALNSFKCKSSSQHYGSTSYGTTTCN